MSLVPFVHLDEPLPGRVVGERVELSAGESHHLRTVLRLRVGAQVVVADGAGGQAEARVLGDGVELTTGVQVTSRVHPQIAVAQALAKGRKTDEVIRAVTELGVDAVTVVAAARSVSRLEPAKAARARERWRAVARAAAEQSRQAFRPTVHGPVVAAQIGDDPGVVYLVHPGGRPLPEELAARGPVERITLAVGPEGGWTDDEVRDLTATGARLVGLGPTVLRTEHAAPAATAVVAAGLGRWRTPGTGGRDAAHEPSDGRGTRPSADGA